jgi:hypothetical protein
VNNPHFANQSRALTSGFTTEGRVSPNRGKKASEETRRKIGAASKGRRPSEKTRKLKSKLMTGEGNPMYGGTHTPEAREKIGAAQRGKTISEEHRQRIIEANKGKTLSEEHKKKLVLGKEMILIEKIFLMLSKVEPLVRSTERI